MTGNSPADGGAGRANPYVGLLPFGADDVGWFFGRDREQQIVGANLRSSRLTLLYGASGVGKSSVLHAAVVPALRTVTAGDRALREQADPELRSPVRFAVSIFAAWRDAPLHGLMRAVAASVEDASGVEPDPWEPGKPLRTTFAAWLGPVTTLLIVLDQFEEYFLYHPREDGPGTVAGEFAEVVNDQGLRVNFLLSLREDGLAKLDRFQGRVPRLFENYLRIDHLDLACARRAIEGPCTQHNRRLPRDAPPAEIDAELVDAVLDEVRTSDETGEGPDPAARVETPLLQLVMQRLWEAAATDAGAPHLRLATLRERLGGTERIVYRHLAEALAALPDAHRELAVDVLRPLVSPTGTKIAWPAEDLAYWAKRAVAEVETLLVELASGNRRILRSVTPPPTRDDRAPRYEIFHDILAAPLLSWCAEREAERARAELARELEAREAERREAAERRRRERRNRAVRIVAIVLAALAIGLVVAALTAREQSKVAQSRALAASATSQLPVDPELGLLLALEAVRRRDTSEAGQALRRAVVASRVRAVLGSGKPRPCRAACAGLSATRGRPVGAVAGPLAIAPGGLTVAGIVGRHIRLWRPQRGTASSPGVDVGGLRGVAFTSDGARLLVVGLTRTAVVPAAGGRAIALRDARTTGIGGATSPDGRHVVTTGLRGAAVWDARTGARLAGVTDRGYYDVAFQDATRIVLTDLDGSVTAWSWRTQRRPQTRAPAHLGARSTRPFAAASRFVVDGVADGRVRVVDVGLRGSVRLPSGSVRDPVTAAATSPRGTRIATVRDSVVDLWRSRRAWHDRAALVGRLVHTDGVNAVVFSPDGALVATASTDSTGRVWESATGDLVAELDGHGAGVQAIAFSSDGRYVATVGDDLTVRLWDLGEELTRREPHAVAAVAASPSGRRLAVAQEDGALEIHDLASFGRGEPARVSSLAPASGPMHPAALAFAARRPVLLAGYATSGGDAGRLRLLREDGTALVDVPVDGSVRNVALDAFARVAAIVRVDSEGTRVELWSLGAGARRARRVPLASTERATDVAISPDGGRLLVTSVYGLARLVDVRTRRVLRTLADGTAANPGSETFYRAAFSPDGRTVAVAGSRDVRLWDAVSGKERATRLTGHTSVLRSVAYSDDGRRIVTASADGTVRVWDAADGTPLAVLSRHAGRVNGAVLLDNGWIASGGDDRAARIYPCETCTGAGTLRTLAQARVTRELTDRELARFGG